MFRASAGRPLPLIAVAQVLLHILDMPFKEPFVGIVTDHVNERIFSPDSSLQLTVLGVSHLPLPSCSSRGRRHADLFFCLGVSPPSPPRPPGRSRRRNLFCCLQYGCRKAVSTSSTLLSLGGNALRWSPTTVATSSRKWGSFVSRRRSIGGGPFASLTGRLRAKRPSSFTYVVTILWSEIGRNDGWECTITSRTSFLSRCLVGMQSIRFLPRPLNVCEIAFLAVLKNVFNSASP